MQGVEDAAVDITTAVRLYSEQVIPQLTGLSGYVFKAKSPSCGLDVPVFNSQGIQISRHQGLFVEAVQVAYPNLPLIDEQDIANPKCRQQFISAALLYFREMAQK